MASRRAIVSTISCAVLGLLLFGDTAFATTPADALQAKCECLFDKTPLKDVTEHLSKVHQVPMKLADGVDGTASVTLKYTGTLKGMLEKALPALGLEYAVDGKDIVIRKKKAEKK